MNHFFLTSQCRICGKQIERTPGRRLRLYCSNACRQRAYRNAKRKEKALQKAEVALKEKYRRIMTDYYSLLVDVRDNPEHAAVFDAVYMEVYQQYEGA